MKLTNEIKEKVIDYLELERIEDLNEFTDNFYLFYNRCKEAGMHYADADRYAILNTLFNYDIGMDNARKIDSWIYEHDEEIYELSVNEADKNLLKQAIKELGIELDFSNFITEMYTEYKFFI